MNFLSFPIRKPRRPKRFPRGPVARLPRSIGHRYRDALLREIVDKWRDAAVSIVLDALPAIARQVAFERPGYGIRKDAWPDEISRRIDLLRTEYDRLSGQSHEIAAGIFQSVNALSHRQWYDHVKKIMELDLLSFEPWIQNESKAWIRENVSLITKLQADTVQDIDRVVTNGFRTGQRVETIRKQILGTDLEPGVFKKVETRAELIARDQTGKLWGDLNQRRQEEAGITIYIWRTSEDERVRDSHSALDGKYCSWNDPTVYSDTLEDAMAGKWKKRSSIDGYEGDPGSDFQCRCYGEAVFETLFAEGT